MRRIVLAFSKDTAVQKIKGMLENSAYAPPVVCRSAAEIRRFCADFDEVLIIMGYKLPDAIADDVFDFLGEGQLLMAIVKAEQQELIRNEELFTLSLPVDRAKLMDAIELLTGHIERRHKERSADEKSIIDKAKLYLMEKYRMTESQAHRFIQKRSMDTGAKFADTARLILNI